MGLSVHQTALLNFYSFFPEAEATNLVISVLVRVSKVAVSSQARADAFPVVQDYL